MLDLRHRIRHFRLRAKMSRREFAKRCGVSTVTAYYWETTTGKGPPARRLPEIADVFGITLTRLLSAKIPPEKGRAA